MASLDESTHQTRAAPLWIGCGQHALTWDLTRRIGLCILLDQGWEPAVPDAQVIRWMKAKLASYR